MDSFDALNHLYLVDDFEKKRHQKILYAVPPLVQMESPASWLSRAALSQGVVPQRLLEIFEIPHRIDFDASLTDLFIARICGVCGIDINSFEFNQHMLSGISVMGERHKNFLLRDSTGPYYRYCPVCFKHQTIKHFPFHWRFKFWRYCPQHLCLMEDRCRSCDLEIRLPAPLMNAGEDRTGLAYLHQCLGCGKFLSNHWASVVGMLGQPVLSLGERKILMNGRSVMAALFQKKFYYIGYESPIALSAFPASILHELLDESNFQLTVVEVASRIERRKNQSG